MGIIGVKYRKMNLMRCVRCGCKLSGNDVRITEGICNCCDRKEQNEKFFEKVVSHDDNQDAGAAAMEMLKNNNVDIKTPVKQFLLIEDGSVDLDEVYELNIPFLVYRKGSTPPIVVEFRGEK